MVELFYNNEGKLQGVATWHIIDGVWRHIAQLGLDVNQIDYYTDGVKETFIQNDEIHDRLEIGI